MAPTVKCSAARTCAARPRRIRSARSSSRRRNAAARASGVVRRHEQPLPVVRDHLRNAAYRRGDDGPAREHRLQQCQGQSFGERWHGEDVRGREEVGNVVAKAEEAYPVLHRCPGQQGADGGAASRSSPAMTRRQGTSSPMHWASACTRTGWPLTDITLPTARTSGSPSRRPSSARTGAGSPDETLIPLGITLNRSGGDAEAGAVDAAGGARDGDRGRARPHRPANRHAPSPSRQHVQAPVEGDHVAPAQ